MLGYFPAKLDSKPVHLMPFYTPDNIIHIVGERKSQHCLHRGGEDPANTTAGRTEVANASYNVVCKSCKKHANIKPKQEKPDSVFAVSLSFRLPESA